MFYTIYKVTNKVNGKIYIGSHKTKNLNDEYMGSGKYLRYSINKHGIENFEKEILFVFDNADEMYAKEAELVNEEFIAESNTYNLKVGGFGGWDYVNKNLSKEQIVSSARLGGLTRHISKKELGKRISENKMKTDSRYNAGKALCKLYPNGTFAGRTHTQEAKDQIGAKSAIHQKGSRNSQYGTCWVHHLTMQCSKRIKKDQLQEYLNNGWLNGAKFKFEKTS